MFYKVFLFVLISTPSYAYIDPGTGGIILQAILAFIAATLVFFSNLKIKLKLFYKNLKQKFNKEEKN